MAWILEVDWDNDGSYADADSDITSYVMDTLKWQIGFRGDQRIADESTMTVTLNNDSKRFSPDNAASPLYGLMVPFRAIRLRIESSPVSVGVMWTGIIDDYDVAPLKFRERTTTLKCKGIMSRLTETRYELDLQIDKSIKQILLSIYQGLNYIPPAFPNPAYLFDADSWAIPFYGDNLQGEKRFVSAYDVIKDLVEMERGYFFFNRLGQAIFYLRYHFMEGLTYPLYTDTATSQITGAGYVSAKENIFTKVSVNCYPRVLGSIINDDLLWTLGAPIRIGKNKTKVIWANYGSAENVVYFGARNVTHFGTTFSQGTAAITLTPFAQSCKITLQNTSSTTVAILTALKLQGQTLTTSNPVTAVAEDTALAAIYGNRILELKLNALSDPDIADERAAFELYMHSATSGFINEISFRRKESTYSGAGYGIQLTIGSGIIIVDEQTGNTSNGYVTMEEHTLEASSGVLSSTFTIMPFPVPSTVPYPSAKPLWVLEDSALGLLEDTTVLGW